MMGGDIHPCPPLWLRACMWVTHGGSSGSSTVYIDRLSAIRAANVAHNYGNMFFFNPNIPGFSHGNPGISGLEKWAGIPGSRDCNPYH